MVEWFGSGVLMAYVSLHLYSCYDYQDDVGLTEGKKAGLMLVETAGRFAFEKNDLEGKGSKVHARST
jgi:hypothetical protein